MMDVMRMFFPDHLKKEEYLNQKMISDILKNYY